MFERDDHSCRFCGFRSKKHHEVVVDSLRPFDVSTMATVCIFCEATLFVDRVETMTNSVLVWLPGVPRPSLNALMRAIYVARISQGPIADKARAVLDKLMLRKTAVTDTLGSATPLAMAARLAQAPDEEAVQRVRHDLSDVLVLPLDRRIIREADLEFNQFPQILAYWRSKDGPFGGRTPPQWAPETFDAILDSDLSPESMTFPPNWLPPLTNEAGGSPIRKQKSTAHSGVPQGLGTTHAALAERLLADAARYYRSIASENSNLRSVMLENANLQEQVVLLLRTDPDGRTGEMTHGTAAANLLRDAAKFFRQIGAGNGNESFREQMNRNADVYEQIANLVEKSPLGRMP